MRREPDLKGAEVSNQGEILLSYFLRGKIIFFEKKSRPLLFITNL